MINAIIIIIIMHVIAWDYCFYYKFVGLFALIQVSQDLCVYPFELDLLIVLLMYEVVVVGMLEMYLFGIDSIGYFKVHLFQISMDIYVKEILVHCNHF